MATETSLAEAQKTFEANMLGIVEMDRQIADMLIRSKGKIVFTSSLSRIRRTRRIALYCASKAALRIYAGALRIEMKPFGVKSCAGLYRGWGWC
ncbi:uncharacterized protein BDV17DRAFT_259321 [Aspergillus undulatus]|uniref:uncharacterized protein n=1 Tax=Aspergillus undulatus TaxID=1810928 RepID=UPI003CCD1CD8